MQQFLYYGADQAHRDQKIRADFPFDSSLVTEFADEVIKIDAIRKLIQKLTLTTQEPRLIYFPDVSSLTLPAQQALLKTLEEPPAKTTFILSASNLSSLLPTIRSRLALVRVNSQPLTKNQEGLALVKSAYQLKPGERVQLADSLGKVRETCISWLDSLISSLYQVMHETHERKGLQMLSSLSELALSVRTDLESNANVNLAMQHFFLSLPHARA